MNQLSFPKFNLSPPIRIGIGIVAIIVSWLTLMDMFVGIWPNQQAMLRELRERTSESLATKSALLIQSGEFAALKKSLEESVNKDNQIYSVALRKKESGKKQGQIVLQAGDHKRYWKPSSSTGSTLDYVRVQISSNHQTWGDLEIAFYPSSTQTIMGWIKRPVVISFLLFILGGIVLCSLYLRKVFDYLDPSSVIPDRVIAAFDVFGEGVMMIDRSGRIVLANKTLRNWVEETNSKLFGTYCKDLPWLRSALRDTPENYPWIRAMATQETIKGQRLDFQTVRGEKIKTIINSSPIQDVKNNVRGCLVTFDNVTELDRINQELIATMVELKKSRKEIEAHNLELSALAARDPMTGCLNRRAFFEEAEKVLISCIKTKRSLACIMTDIDHFKLFNDRYGHATGDKVIVAFVRALSRGLRADDLLCRYGGEEFCILIADATPEVVFTIAERMRVEVETQAGASIRGAVELKITTSFGLVMLSDGVTEIDVLLDQADQALYVAKNSGRNCVKIWQGGEGKSG